MIPITKTIFQLKQTKDVIQNAVNHSTERGNGVITLHPPQVPQGGSNIQTHLPVSGSYIGGGRVERRGRGASAGSGSWSGVSSIDGPPCSET